MKQETLYGVSLDVCPNCGGTWFQADELRMLLHCPPDALKELEAETVPHVEQVKSTPSAMRCPDDGGVLDNYHYMYSTPVILHTCANCGGFWIGAGEVAKIDMLHQQSHGPMTEKEKGALYMAEAITDHEKEMSRLRGLKGLFTSLDRYMPGWYGFF